ncbi:hypothetical protein BH10BAC1_BH10BAC1_05060 [soil metagenome]
MKYSSLFVLAFCFALSSCTPVLDMPEPSAGDADFSKMIAVGGNYLA